MVEFRDGSYDIGLNTDLNFLNLEDDELTEAALRRITQMIDSRQEAIQNRSPITTEPSVLRECKLFLNITAVDSVPSKHGCLGLCRPKYQCDVEILGNRQAYLLKSRTSDIGEHYDTLVNDRQSYFANDCKRSTPCWDLAEYYGPTKITFKLKRRKLLKDIIVGAKTVHLSELLGAQARATARQLAAPTQKSAWSVDYSIPITTTLKTKKRKQDDKTSHWLNTAKNASMSVSTDHHDEGKPMMDAEVPALGSRAQAYVQVPSDAGHGHGRKDKGTEVQIRVEFRIVQFQNCQHLCLTQPLPALATLCSVAPTSRSAAPTSAPLSENAYSTGTQQISELHLLAANAPAGVVVEVMRGLSRRDALAGALALRTAESDSISSSSTDKSKSIVNPTHSVSPESSIRSLRFGAASSRRTAENVPVGSSGSSTNPAPAPVPPTSAPKEGVPTAWTPLECALLSQQEATVLELLQRCGGLCFTNITAGYATPLHTAVRGGSSQCVEYVGRYLKRYGTKNVTGPGARLWNSSLSAKLEWKDQNGDTVLALACRLPRTMNAHTIVIYLLMLGADPGAFNEQNGFTPLMYACQSGATKVVSILLSITKSSQDIMDAILNVGDVNSILNNVANLDVEPAVRDQIQSAIADAAHSARSSALATHLQSNQRSRNILRGDNLLEGGFFNPMSLYLCDPCRKDTATGRHAMHLAAEHGFTEIVQALLDIGMGGGEIDFFGDNCIHIAARRGHSSLVTRLLETERKAWAMHLELVGQGKSLQIMHHRAQHLLAQNSMGDSPVDLALEGCHFSIAENLIAGAVEIYGRVDHLLLRKLLRQVDECAARLTVQSPAFPSFSFSSSTSSGASKRSDKHANKEGHEDGDKHLTRCRALLVRLLEESKSRAVADSTDVSEIEAFRVNTSEKALQEVAFIDNEADSVEYLMALSSLGLKYITDNLSSSSAPHHAAHISSAKSGGTSSAVGNEDVTEEKKDM